MKRNDDRNYWCGTAAQAPVITDREGLSYCAVQMPNYVTPEEGGEAAAERQWKHCLMEKESGRKSS